MASCPKQKYKKPYARYAVMVSTVAQLAASAKMNLRHEDCWQIFNAVIKPQVEQLISSYFSDWQKIEEDVTAIVMKHKGIFTSRLIITRIDDNATEVPQLRDAEEFRRIKRSSFKGKLCYLLDNKLISQPIYGLLSNLAKRRNRIHEYAEVLTDDDRALFSYGYGLLHATYTARCFETERDYMAYQIEQNDKAAIELLKLIHAQESSKFQGSLFVDIEQISLATTGGIQPLCVVDHCLQVVILILVARAIALHKLIKFFNQ
jgi:hypothetical protein